VRYTAAPGSTFIDRMIRLVEGAERQKTPNEIALDILLAGLTIIIRVREPRPSRATSTYAGGAVSVVILVALFVTLIPTTHRRASLRHRHRRHGPPGALQRAGDVRPRRRGRGRRRHAAARQDGTITLGNRQATEFRPVRGVSEQELADAAQLASLSDETPEGRSIRSAGQGEVRPPGPRSRRDQGPSSCPSPPRCRMSGVDIGDSWVRKGAVDSVLSFLSPSPVSVGSAAMRLAPSSLSPDTVREVQGIAEAIAKAGGTPLAVAKDGKLLGVIHLKDIVKGRHPASASPNCAAWAIRTVMITGDNPMTCCRNRGGSRCR